MELTGKIVRVFEPQQGTSKAGREWKKREYLMEVPSNNSEYGPRQVFFNFFGDRADQFILEGGKEYTISFDIESREFNNRWYTDIRAWRAQPAGNASAGNNGSDIPVPPTYPEENPFDTPSVSDSNAPEGDPFNDLPF